MYYNKKYIKIIKKILIIYNKCINTKSVLWKTHPSQIFRIEVNLVLLLLTFGLDNLEYCVTSLLRNMNLVAKATV